MRVPCIIAVLSLTIAGCSAHPKSVVSSSASETTSPKPAPLAKPPSAPPWLAPTVAPIANTHLTRVLDSLDPYYNGITRVVTPVEDYSEHLGANGGVSVVVTDSTGRLLADAPVTFSSDNDLLTANPYGRGKVHILTVYTDDEGVATVYVRPLTDN